MPGGDPIRFSQIAVLESGEEGDELLAGEGWKGMESLKCLLSFFSVDW
jgi:hypothetical protein